VARRYNEPRPPGDRRPGRPAAAAGLPPRRWRSTARAAVVSRRRFVLGGLDHTDGRDDAEASPSRSTPGSPCS